MELSDLDDLPYHQGFAPFPTPVTSDTHYNDGYYFAFYRPGIHVFCGLRLHANTNVMDGYGGAVVGGEQRSVRVSRALRPQLADLAVGPLRVEIAEPMRAARIELGENPTGIAFAVELRASAPPFFEAPHVQHRHGRLLNHVLRYTQTARAHGHVTVDGERIEVDGWHAARDHSWGVRSTMGPHLPVHGVAAAAGPPDPRAIRIWMPFEVADHRGFFHLHEDADGNVLDFEGRLDLGDGEAVDLVGARHAFRYVPGTRRLEGGSFTLRDATGGQRDYSFEVACEPAHPQGFGYARGWSDGGQPGVWRGERAAEHDRFAVADPAALAGPDHVPEARRLGGTEFVSTLRGPGGAEGMAHVEHMIYGPYRPYGLT